MDNQISNDNRFILEGRVYPAIKACVNNRYKIALGFFAFYSYILNSANPIITDNLPSIRLWGSILFAFFIVHNLMNYKENAKNQEKLETGNSKGFFELCGMEFLFSVIMTLVIVTSYLLVPSSAKESSCNIPITIRSECTVSANIELRK